MKNCMSYGAAYKKEVKKNKHRDGHEIFTFIANLKLQKNKKKNNTEILH